MITLSGIKRFFDTIDSGHTWECVVEGSEIEDVKTVPSVLTDKKCPQPAFRHPYPGRRVRHRPSGF